MKKVSNKYALHLCCSPTNIKAVECSAEYENEPIAERIKRLKKNPYLTKAVWESKTIYIVDTDTWYSYADLDKLINN